MPGTVLAFSAQDVLTLCLANHADPGSLRDKLRSSGWKDITPTADNNVADTLTLATLATWLPNNRKSFSSENWKQDWTNAQGVTDLMLNALGENSSLTFIDPETKSLLLISWRDGFARDVRCVLAVTEAATKSKSYHPRLQEPDTGDAFYSLFESSDNSSIGTQRATFSVSVDKDLVKQAIGIDLDVAAVFRTVSIYPLSVVSP